MNYEAKMDAFVTARKVFMELWWSKSKLWQIACAKLPKGHPALKFIARGCWRRLDRIRFEADVAICKYANIFGDAPFERAVDGVRLPGATHWFYGTSPETGSETKKGMISGADVMLLATVWKLGETFAGLAAELPFASEKTIKKQMARCQKDFFASFALVCRAIARSSGLREAPTGFARRRRRAHIELLRLSARERSRGGK